jgi:hypothetical protein
VARHLRTVSTDRGATVVVMTLAWPKKSTHRDYGVYGTVLIHMSDFMTIAVIARQLQALRGEVLGGFISLGGT